MEHLLQRASRSLSGHLIFFGLALGGACVALGLDIVQQDSDLSPQLVLKVIVVSLAAGLAVGWLCWYTITKPYLDRDNNPGR